MIQEHKSLQSSLQGTRLYLESFQEWFITLRCYSEEPPTSLQPSQFSQSCQLRTQSSHNMENALSCDYCWLQLSYISCLESFHKWFITHRWYVEDPPTSWEPSHFSQSHQWWSQSSQNMEAALSWEYGWLQLSYMSYLESIQEWFIALRCYPEETPTSLQPFHFSQSSQWWTQSSQNMETALICDYGWMQLSYMSYLESIQEWFIGLRRFREDPPTSWEPSHFSQSCQLRTQSSQTMETALVSCDNGWLPLSYISCLQSIKEWLIGLRCYPEEQPASLQPSHSSQSFQIRTQSSQNMETALSCDNGW
jgi:hypothetical protein